MIVLDTNVISELWCIGLRRAPRSGCVRRRCVFWRGGAFGQVGGDLAEDAGQIGDALQGEDADPEHGFDVAAAPGK